MESDFLGLFERFELMAFFSGYAIVYVLLNGIWRGDHLFGIPKARILTYSYALTATLFLGYTARKVFLGSGTDIQLHFYHPFLYFFGILAILFWLPRLTRRNVPLLLHSLVFFAFIPMDIVSYFRGFTEKTQVRNDMNILSLSIVVNVTTAIIVFTFLWLSDKKRGRTGKVEIS